MARPQWIEVMRVGGNRAIFQRNGNPERVSLKLTMIGDNGQPLEHNGIPWAITRVAPHTAAAVEAIAEALGWHAPEYESTGE